MLQTEKAKATSVFPLYHIYNCVGFASRAYTNHALNTCFEAKTQLLYEFDVQEVFSFARGAGCFVVGVRFCV